MAFLFKTLFFCGLVTLSVSFYGDDLIRIINQGSIPDKNGASNKSSSNVNIVRTLKIPRQSDGHYWLDMNASGSNIRFIVDTGASYVTLSHRDAEQLNLHLSENDYDVPVNTAGGLTTMAEANIDVLTFGSIELYDVQAFVAREGMLNVSLLGMNYLNRLDRFEFRDRQLIFEQ